MCVCVCVCVCVCACAQMHMCAFVCVYSVHICISAVLNSLFSTCARTGQDRESYSNWGKTLAPRLLCKVPRKYQMLHIRTYIHT